MIEARVVLLLERLHAAIDFALFRLQRFELPATVMDDADRRSKSKLQSARSHYHGVLRIVNASANHGVDVDMEDSMLGEQLQLLIKDLQTLFRDVVRLHVVDRNLQVVEPGIIQPMNAFGG